MEGLGSRIKQVRGALTQDDFARMLSIERATLASWEIDRREPAIEHLIRIADIAKVSLDWLTGRARYNNIDEAQLYHDARWKTVIFLAATNCIMPDRLITLIKVALSLKRE